MLLGLHVKHQTMFNTRFHVLIGMLLVALCACLSTSEAQYTSVHHSVDNNEINDEVGVRTLGATDGGATPAMQPSCDVDLFTSEHLPDFISSCADLESADYECPEDCQDALNALVTTRHVSSCMAKLIHQPALFRGKGVFADTELVQKMSKGLPDFTATIRLDGHDVTLSRSFLAETFLQAVAYCNSEVASLNGGTCGNARMEVYTSTTVPAMLSACSVKNALVLQPPICAPDCSHAYFNVRSHACFSRFFTAVDTAAANQTRLQLLDARLTQHHAPVGAASQPDKRAVHTRVVLRNAARICSPPDRSTFLNISSCSSDDLEVYMRLSVQPFHASCAANVSHSDPNQRYCTAECDAMLQQVLWEPACLGLWSSTEASKLSAGKGTSAELVTLTRAIQVCAIARHVSYSYEAQVTFVNDAPIYTLAHGSTSHPAVKAMFFLLCGFLFIVGTLTAWQQRRRCSRSGVRYQRVVRQEV